MKFSVKVPLKGAVERRVAGASRIIARPPASIRGRAVSASGDRGRRCLRGRHGGRGGGGGEGVLVDRVGVSAVLPHLVQAQVGLVHAGLELEPGLR